MRLLTLLITLSVSFAQTLETPRPGSWSVGPRFNRKDLSPDAVTAGRFVLGSTSSVATVFVGCKGVLEGAPVLELRASVPAFSQQDAIPKEATVTIGARRFSAPLDSFPIGKQILFISPLSAEQSAALAKNAAATHNALAIVFRTAAGSGGIAADLPPGGLALDAAISACGGAPTVQTTVVKSQLPADWHIEKTDNGMEATIPGIVEAKGQSREAKLSFSCQVAQYSGTHKFWAEAKGRLSVPYAFIDFESSEITIEGGGQDFGRSRLGNKPEIHLGMAADDVGDPLAPENKNQLAPFDLRYVEPDLKEIVQTAGAPLQIVIHPISTKRDAMVARFPLPADGTPLQYMMEPCLQMLEASEKRQRAADLVSCPILSGNVLRKADVLTGPNGKPFPWVQDAEAPAWELPPVTKADPVRPKFTLACYYNLVETVDNFSDRRLLPIPANAGYCSFTQSATENRSHAECSMKPVPEW